MNVKAGDLAIMVNVFDERLACNRGRIFEVLTLDVVKSCLYGEPVWELQPQNPTPAGKGDVILAPNMQVGTAFDRNLRPISGLPDCDDVPESEPVKEKDHERV